MGAGKAKYLEYIKGAKSFYIEASAGTGKTYSIMQMVKALLAGDIGEDISTRELCTLDKILIVTYTEKAVGELKDRVRKELKAAIENKGDKESGGRYTPEQVELFSQALKISSNAPIFTIHSFCQTMLKEAAFLAKVPTGLEMTDDSNIRNVLEEKLRDEYADEVESLSDNRADILQLLQKNKGFVDILQATSDGYYLDKQGRSVNNIVSLTSAESWCDGKAIEKKFIADKIDKVYRDWLFEKQYSRLQSFNDMIRNLREAVCENDGKNALLKHLRSKFKIAIIDEFQDTNQKQWDIFRTIFLDEKNAFLDGDKHCLVVVGDPKQSIYSFQGADVNVYNKAKDEFNGDCDELKVNYRSSAAMIDACNVLFDQENNSYFGSGKIKFSNSSAPDKKQDSTEKISSAQPVWLAVKDKGDSVINEYEFASFAVQKMIECVKNGYKYSDFAILCRVRSELYPIISKLNQFGIPYVKYKDTGLFEGKECADWIALLEAIYADDFADNKRKILQKALFTKFFRIPLFNLESPEYNNPECKERVIIQFFKKLVEQKKWFELIDAIIEKTCIDTALEDFRYQNMLFKFRQIGDYIQEYLISNKGDLKGCIEHLSSLNSSAFDEEIQDDGDVVSIGTDSDSVKVMTIHASKGLEFPVVISVAGFKDKNNQVKHCWQGYGDSGAKFIDIRNEKELKKGEVCIKDISAAEQKEEFKRLFYVDYTRAKSLLILPYYKYPKNFDFVKSAIDRIKDDASIVKKFDISQMKYISAADYKREQRKIQKVSGATQEGGEKPQDRVKRLKQADDNAHRALSSKHSYSSLRDVFGIGEIDSAAKQIIIPSLYGGDENSSGYRMLKGGAFFGTALHEIFEKCNFANFDEKISTEKIFENIKFIKQVLAHNGLYQSSNDNDNTCINAVYAMVVHTLNAHLPKIRGAEGPVNEKDILRLCDIEAKCRTPEAEFIFNLPDDGAWIRQFCNGFIDLLFTWSDGGKKRYCILDWKSDTFEEGKSYNDPRDLKEKVDEEYSVQRVLYSYCLIRWLANMYAVSPEIAFNEYFGGIYYAFARGSESGRSNGIYAQSWDSFDHLYQAYDAIHTRLQGIGT